MMRDLFKGSEGYAERHEHKTSHYKLNPKVEIVRDLFSPILKFRITKTNGTFLDDLYDYDMQPIG